MERDDDNQIEALIDAGKARSYAAADFLTRKRDAILSFLTL